jgi:hypothetical protein
MSRPRLLVELNEYLEAALKQNPDVEEIIDPDIVPMGDLNVYRKAFGRFVEANTLYKPILASVMREYDSTIASFEDKLMEMNSLKRKLSEQATRHELNEKERTDLFLRLAADLQREKEHHREEMERSIAQLREIQVQNDLFRQEMAKSEDRVREMREKSLLLAKALSSLEKKNKELAESATDANAELAAARITNERSVEEVKRLREQVHDLQQSQGNMVPRASVQMYIDGAATAKETLATLSKDHKTFVQRYTNLKSVIESAFQHAAQTAGTTSGEEGSTTGSYAAVSSTPFASMTIADVHAPDKPEQDNTPLAHPFGDNRDAPARDAPAMAIIKLGRAGLSGDDLEVKVRELESRGVSPRVIMEALLDELQELRHEVAQLSGGVNLEGRDKARDVTDDSDSSWRHFEGLGFGECVPKYLRCNGVVENQLWSKGETEGTINKIWDEKKEFETALAADEEAKAREQARAAAAAMACVAAAAEAEAQGLVPENPVSITRVGTEEAKQGAKPCNELRHLDNFLLYYIEQHFPEGPRRVTFAYNLIESLKRYQFDSDCKLFLFILDRQISEEIRDDQIALLEQLEKDMEREESMTRGKVEGVLSRDAFLRVLRRALAGKSERSMTRLEKALMLETSGGAVLHYKDLLGEDEEGNQGVFCETLRNQHMSECALYKSQLDSSIRDACEAPEAKPITGISTTKESQKGKADTSEQKGGKIKIGRIRDIIAQIDPHKSRAEINSYLARGMRLLLEDVLLLEAKQELVNVDDFLDALHEGLLKPSQSGKNASA